MATPVVNEILRKLQALPDNLQKQVLLFVDALHVSSKRGKPGSALLEFAGSIPAEDLVRMQKAINEGCEQIEPDEW